MKLPFISRSRYERELELLRDAYGVRTDDLRNRLMSIIERFSMVVINRSKKYGGMEIHAKFNLSEDEFQKLCFSPSEREELWFYIGKRITEEIKKQARAVALMESTNDPHP